MREKRTIMEYMADILAVVLMLACLAICAAGVYVVIAGTQTEKQINTAKIRYFDGSTDTLQITRYAINEDAVTVWTRDGGVCITGANNIILVSDDDYPRD